jgi:[ribosomal protein S18]-alanine N-acetyltransferase
VRNDVVISAATASDVDAIHGLEVAAFPSPWRREFFEGELHASGRLALTAKKGGTLIGYLFAMWFFDEMHVNKIAVEEHERRQGIANELMNRCITFARGHGVKTIALEVRKTNQGAQEFYRALDFEPLYLRPRYYPDGEGAVVMVLKVSD